MPNILDDFDEIGPVSVDEDAEWLPKNKVRSYISDKIRQVLDEMEKSDKNKYMGSTEDFDVSSSTRAEWQADGYNLRNAEFRADKNRILSGLERKE